MFSSFIKIVGFKNIVLFFIVIAVVGNYVYQYKKIDDLHKQVIEKDNKLEEANKNNKLMHEAYEKTLAIEREIAEQKLQTQEQKEKVVVKYKTLEKEIEKRGEDAGDMASCDRVRISSGLPHSRVSYTPFLFFSLWETD